MLDEPHLARLVCMSRHRVHLAIKEGSLPPPRVIAGMQMWSLKEVNACVARLFGLDGVERVREKQAATALEALDAWGPAEPPAVRRGEGQSKGRRYLYYRREGKRVARLPEPEGSAAFLLEYDRVRKEFEHPDGTPSARQSRFSEGAPITACWLRKAADNTISTWTNLQPEQGT